MSRQTRYREQRYGIAQVLPSKTPTSSDELFRQYNDEPKMPIVPAKIRG